MKCRVLFVLLVFPMVAFPCNMDLDNGLIGPYDYSDPSNHEPNSRNISQVTNVHLTPPMLILKKGQTGTISSDLDYTLRAIPNHPQALDLASRLERAITIGIGAPKYEKMIRSAECYFQRGIKLNPKATATRVVYAVHLHRAGKFSEALNQYEIAIDNGGSTTNLYYNYGLALVKVKRYEEAAKYARLAYDAGYPLPGLKKKLVEAGVAFE